MMWNIDEFIFACFGGEAISSGACLTHFQQKSRFEWTGTHSIFAKCAFQVGLVPLVFTKCGVSSGLLPTRSSNKSSFEWDQNCR